MKLVLLSETYYLTHWWTRFNRHEFQLGSFIETIVLHRIVCDWTNDGTYLVRSIRQL